MKHYRNLKKRRTSRESSPIPVVSMKQSFTSSEGFKQVESDLLSNEKSPDYFILPSSPSKSPQDEPSISVKQLTGEKRGCKKSRPTIDTAHTFTHLNSSRKTNGSVCSSKIRRSRDDRKSVREVLVGSFQTPKNSEIPNKLVLSYARNTISSNKKSKR